MSEESVWLREREGTEVPLEVVQRLGGALSPEEIAAASRGEPDALLRLFLRAHLVSARISLEKGQTERAQQELEDVQLYLRHVGSADGAEREITELKKDVERSLVARSLSPENVFHIFSEINRIIHSSESLGDKVGQVLARVADAVGADRAFWASYDTTHGKLSPTASAALTMEQAEQLLAGVRAGSHDVLERGRAVISVNVPTDERFQFPSSLGPIGSLILVPCGTGATVTGVVYFDRQADGTGETFSQTDLDLVTALAGSLEAMAAEVQLGLERRANKALLRQLSDKYSWHNIVTQNKEMIEILKVLERISPSNMTVLLQGETGTGKQLLAQAVHHNSPRRDRPFVTIDCAALSSHLLESELFGHQKGAFTGAASDRKGLFEEAHGGTVFLDEIDKTDHELQRRLLHVLDQGEVRPVGAQEYRKVDLRIICATSNPDLRRAVEEGKFIKDLFYRLNDISVSIPPLRERREDVTGLVEHFLDKSSRELRKPRPAGLARECMKVFMDYNWPGNVRELEKVIRRAVVLAEEGHAIRPEDLPPELRGDGGAAHGPPSSLENGGEELEPATLGPGALAGKVEALEKREVLAALNHYGWNKSQAARHLGLTRKGLRMKIERYGLDPSGQGAAE